MALSKFEPIWKLINEHKFQLDAEFIDPNLFCVMCSNLLADACESICECHYCFKCINEYLKNGDKCCPGNRSECKEHCLVMNRDVFRSPSLNNRIYKLKVICPNNSCHLSLPLTEIEEHLRVCTKQPLPCPYVKVGCQNDRLSKDNITSHLNNDLLSHVQLLIDWIEGLTNEVNELKESTEKNTMEIVSLKNEINMKNEVIVHTIEQMIEQNKEIESVKESCRDKDSRIKTLEEQLKDVMGVRVNGEGEERMERMMVNIFPRIMEEVDKVRNGMEVILEERMGMIEEQKVEIVKLRNEMDLRLSAKKEERMGMMKQQIRETLKLKKEIDLRMKGEKDEIMGMINDHKKGIDKTWKESEFNMSGEIINVRRMVYKMRDEGCKSDEYRDRVMLRWTKMCVNMTADFLWKIEGYSKKRGQWIESEPFYSNNYKLCLRIFLYNYEDNIGLYYCIMKGDNDDVIQWPMRHKVTLSIINQSNMRTMKAETFNYDNNYIKIDKKVFAKPMSDINEKIGFNYNWPAKEMPLIIADDCIVVSCIINNP